MKNNDLQILNLPSPGSKVSRRELARTFLAAITGLTLPAIASEHPIWRHLRDAVILDQADVKLASPGWKPIFLTHQQEESLRAIAEAMVPGSTKAFVSRFIDLLLSVENHTGQQQFLGSLSSFDDESSKKYGKRFARIDSRQQDSLLTAFSSAPRSGDAASRMRGHLEDLKEWIAGAYYSSELGMRELGWTPNRVFSTFPACNHPDGHA